MSLNHKYPCGFIKSWQVSVDQHHKDPYVSMEIHWFNIMEDFLKRSKEGMKCVYLLTSDDIEELVHMGIDNIISSE